LVRANSKADRPNDGFDAALRRGIGAASARHRRGIGAASARHRRGIGAASARVSTRERISAGTLGQSPTSADLHPRRPTSAPG